MYRITRGDVMPGVQQVIMIFALFLILAGSAFAQPQEDIAEESMNPLSTVISIPFENNTLFDLGPSNSTANILTVKPIFPVSVGKWNLINRMLMPIIYTEG
jgi:hypothetical protein